MKKQRSLLHQGQAWAPGGCTPHRHVDLQQQQQQQPQQQQQQQQHHQRRQDCARRLAFDLTLQEAKDAEIRAKLQEEEVARKAARILASRDSR
jgi:hypothetical protein